MNRREFVKALAGIPLLGLLVKMPKAEEGTLTFVAPEELCVGYAGGDGGSYLRAEFDAEEQWPPDSLAITYYDSMGRYIESTWTGNEWRSRLIDDKELEEILA